MIGVSEEFSLKYDAALAAIPVRRFGSRGYLSSELIEYEVMDCFGAECWR